MFYSFSIKVNLIDRRTLVLWSKIWYGAVICCFVSIKLIQWYLQQQLTLLFYFQAPSLVPQSNKEQYDYLVTVVNPGKRISQDDEALMAVGGHV